MRTLQLGAAPALPASVTNYQIAPTAAPPPAQVSFFSKVGTLFTKVNDTVNKLAPVVSSVKSTVSTIKSGGGSATMNTDVYTGGGLPAAQQPGLSTGAKVAIGAGALVGVGLLGYALFGGKKKKSSNLAGMKNIIIKNPTSGVEHTITFKQTSHSPGKIVILNDGRKVGKINKKSKAIFAPDYIAKAVKEQIDEIV